VDFSFHFFLFLLTRCFDKRYMLGYGDQAYTTCGGWQEDLLSRLSKHGFRAIDVLAAACDKGDINAAKVILGKNAAGLEGGGYQPDGEQPGAGDHPARIYVRAGEGGKSVKLPNININITEKKEPVRVQEVDITPSLKASLPAAEAAPKNLKGEREKGVFR